MGSHLITAIGQDPVLRHVKLVAEPWDASMDGYRVGRVPAAVGRVERPVPRHDARLLARRTPPAYATVAYAARRVERPLRRRRPLAVRVGQLRHRPRRLHAARPRVLQRTSTTRPTARTTATAPTTTGRGTAASRARPTTRRSSRCAGARPRNLMATLLLLQRRADADRRRRARPHPGRQQQRLLPGQRDVVDRLATRRRVARRLRDHQDRAAAAPRAPGAAPAALLRGPPDDQRRHQGPRRGCTPTAARCPTDDWNDDSCRTRRDVPRRRAAALPRPARRAGARQVLPDLAQRRHRRRRSSRSRTTSGCTTARWCCRPTPSIAVGTADPGRQRRCELQAQSVLVLRQT